MSVFNKNINKKVKKVFKDNINKMVEKNFKKSSQNILCKKVFKGKNSKYFPEFYCKISLKNILTLQHIIVIKILKILIKKYF